MDRPSEHLNELSRNYPSAWKNVETMLAGRGVDLPDWPRWCFMPMAAWLAVGSQGASSDDPRLQKAAGDVARLAALGTWRYSQGIYRFDEDFLAAMADTALDGDMPTDVLLRLPEWCVYIETPRWSWFGESLYGFWVHLEWDVKTHRQELRFVLDTSNGLVTHVLHLGPWSVREATTRWFAEAQVQAEANSMPSVSVSEEDVTAMGRSIQPLLALVLYLCSDEPEIDNRTFPGEQPGFARPKKTKKGWRFFPPDKPRIWTVGDEVGAQLRAQKQAQSEYTGRSVRTHLRRAHWHGYWTGPKNGERIFRYKWLPPVIVRGGD